jgi:hypothetical protein
MHTGEGAYLSRARRASDYTMEEMYHGGIMNNEDNSGDLVGFKGILARWMYCFATNCNQPDVMEWMKKNAMTAWGNRNSKGIVGTTWDMKASDEGKIIPFSASTAVSALNNCKESCKTSLKAAEFNNADEFTRCGKLLVTERKDGALTLDVIEENAYLEYANIKFPEAYSHINIKSNGDADVSIEIRLGTPDGERLGTVLVGQDGNADLDVQGIDGTQRIYLVFPKTCEGITISGFQFVS